MQLTRLVFFLIRMERSHMVMTTSEQSISRMHSQAKLPTVMSSEAPKKIKIRRFYSIWRSFRMYVPNFLRSARMRHFGSRRNCMKRNLLPIHELMREYYRAQWQKKSTKISPVCAAIRLLITLPKKFYRWVHISQ